MFYRREEGRVSDFKLHPTGERSYAVRTGVVNGFGLRMQEIVVLGDDFEEVDRVTTVGLNHTDNHDFLIRDDGNYVLLAYHGAIRDLTAEGGTLVWSYSREGAYTRSQGSAQRLPNGNTLVGWGNGPDIMGTEVDPSGEIVWELTGQLDGESVLSYRVLRADR